LHSEDVFTDYDVIPLTVSINACRFRVARLIVENHAFPLIEACWMDAYKEANGE
jgi:hypothetical protein